MFGDTEMEEFCVSVRDTNGLAGQSEMEGFMPNKRQREPCGTPFGNPRQAPKRFSDY